MRQAAVLAERLAGLPRSERRTALQHEITAMFRRALLMEETDELAPDANYFDLGISSLLITGIKQDLEVALGCAVDTGELFGRPSIAQVVEHISDRCLPDLFGGPVAAPAMAAGSTKPLVDRLISSLYEP
jgi:acyl carrier protein